MNALLPTICAAGAFEFADVYTGIWRFVAPVLAFIVLLRFAKPLLRFRKEPEVWGWLVMPDEEQLPITHWENMIGRSKSSDIVVNFPTISRNHAVLTRYGDGSWSITDVGSRGGVLLNGVAVRYSAVKYGDVITLGGIEMVLAPMTPEEVEEQNRLRTRPSEMRLPGLTLLLLTFFQCGTALQHTTSCEAENLVRIVTAFGVLIAVQWILFFTLKLLHRNSFEIEGLAFFLSTLGLSVIASYRPSAVSKQLICVVGGVIIYLVLCWSLRDLKRAKLCRYLAAAGGLLLLAINLVVGLIMKQETNGASNWIMLGGFSLQPSELVKICFIYVGASTLDRIVTKRNLITFIIYSVAVCGSLALINDFGAALIFFVAFLVIAFLRSGSFATIALACTATGLAGTLAVAARPHIMRRFSNWGNVWNDVQGGGFDQSRAMMCVAAGGLFGVGAGNGIFKLQHITAPDTDYVFAYVCEEWGLLLGLLMIVAVIVMALFVFRSCIVGRSSFYTIGACAAVTILMTQTILNALGTMDILPLTGVTFPFVSNGGSSMLASWGLLAFIKASDTRQNASLAVKVADASEVEQYE